MKVRLKIRFNSAKEYFEKMGPNYYVIYIKESQGPVAGAIIREYLSGQLSVRPDKIQLIRADDSGGWVAVID